MEFFLETQDDFNRFLKSVVCPQCEEIGCFDYILEFDEAEEDSDTTHDFWTTPIVVWCTKCNWETKGQELYDVSFNEMEPWKWEGKRESFYKFAINEKDGDEGPDSCNRNG